MSQPEAEEVLFTEDGGGSAFMEAESSAATPSDDRNSPAEGSEDQGPEESRDGEAASPKDTVAIAPMLPPSSGDIDIEENSVSYLLSVYNFLRSFSRQLFLSPFGLDEFVWSLNCATQCSLIDAVHVSLLRALRRHLEGISSEAVSDPAVRCLRHQDWSLIDNLTWPVFFTQYLYVMGHVQELKRLGLKDGLLNTEYHRLTVPSKLWILHTLCDGVLDSADFVAELESREDAEEVKECVLDPDPVIENRPRRMHPRNSKTSACKDAEALKNSVEPPIIETRSKGLHADVNSADISVDENSDECALCGMDGTLICCDGCPSAYHTRCIGVSKASLPDKWFCPECVINNLGPVYSWIARGMRGAEIFGTDSYGRAFFGTCRYLIVLGISMNTEPCSRYYNWDDIPKLLSALSFGREDMSEYAAIFHGILKYFKLSPSIPLTDRIEVARPLVCGDKCLSEGKGAGNIQENGIASYPMQAISLKDEYFASKNAAPLLCLEPRARFSQVGGIVGIPSEFKQGFERDKRPPRAAYFKPHAYVNQYMYGDVAAAAVANMASLDSQESTLSEPARISNSKKIISAQIMAQMKAFSAASVYFLWPSSERKVMEVPRERCGWCFACKGATTTKKGCLLNLAASGVFKVSCRYISSRSSVKHDDNHRSVVAAHISHMEKSLRGLLDGQLSDPEYNRQWHRQLSESSSCNVLSLFLLELEESIRGIALSGSWNKLVDDGSVDIHADTVTTFNIGSNHKRGTHGRRGKRQQSLAPESSSKEDGWMWWKGGKHSKVVFQKWVLPGLLVRKAARQGGYRWISSVCYLESSELPRISRRLAWRNSVENSRSMSQLALQVRYLDACVRWRDLVRPEQAPLDGKGSESDASVFRNAVICDKRDDKDKILYGLSFSNQKHLPLRVTRTVAEVEDTQDGNKKLWFYEVHIPLYLIKEFEEKRGETLMAKASYPCMSRFQRSIRMKARRKDPFSYLWNKEEMSKRVCCASCRKDVVMRDAVKCNTCQGSCHKGCVSFSTIKMHDDLGFLYSCSVCALSQASRVEKKPKNVLVHLPSQNQVHMAVYAKLGPQAPLAADVKPKPPLAADVKPQPPVTLDGGKFDARLEVGSNASSSLSSGRKRKPLGEVVSYGLIWRRKNGDQPGRDFRLKNIVLKCKDGSVPSSRQPKCALCLQPYRSDLLYICCECCSNWFHADALHLEEFQVVDLVGFKCNKCRRKGMPKCPYKNPIYKKPDGESLKKLKVERNEVALCNSNFPVARAPALLSHSKAAAAGVSSPLDHMESPIKSLQVDEPMPAQELEKNAQFRESDSADQCQLGMLSRGGRVHGTDQFYRADNGNSISGIHPRSLTKLPVRRNDIKHETRANGFFTSEGAPASEYALGISGLDAGVPSASTSAGNGRIEDAAYGPQTAFSFTELLSSEGGEFVRLCEESLVEGKWCPDSFGSYSFISNDPAPALNGVPCEKCKNGDPSADLTCAVCRLRIHSYCSPWDESEGTSEDGQWKCGSCREWR